MDQNSALSPEDLMASVACSQVAHRYWQFNTLLFCWLNSHAK